MNRLCMKFKMLTELFFFTTTLFTMLYVSVSISPTRRQPFHDRITSLRGEVWAHNIVSDHVTYVLRYRFCLFLQFSYWNFEFFDDMVYLIFHFIRYIIHITGPENFDKLLNTRVPTDIWAYVLYYFITEKNFPAVTYALKKISNSNVCIRKLEFDLHPLCDLNLLTNYPDISDFMKYLLICNCDYTTLSTHTGDKYIHAAVKITFATSKFM